MRQVSVSDNGIGIPIEEQSLIFDKFYRVQSDATQDISGTGLGLSIVKSIIDKHHGRIWVDSEPGKGSTFTFLLPRFNGDQPTFNSHAATESQASTRENLAVRKEDAS